MRVNAFTPTREEIGDPMAALARVAAFRKRMYAQPKPVQKPVETKVVKLESPTTVQPVVIKPPKPIYPHIYAAPLQGPCRPSDWRFPFYNGERDIIDLGPTVSIADCIAYISKTEGVAKSEIIGPWRNKYICEARHKAMWVARKYSGKSYPAIGRAFAGRDWTTIIHGFKKVEALIAAGKWTPPTFDQVSGWVVK